MSSLQLHVDFRATATPIDMIGAIDQAKAAAEAAELRFNALRSEVLTMRRKHRADALRMAAVACSAGALMGTYCGRGWALIFAAVIFCSSACVAVADKVKGAKA